MPKTRELIPITSDEYRELLIIKGKYEQLTSNRKTNNITAIKRDVQDYKKVIETQGKALRKLNDRIRAKTSEITNLKQEIGRLHNTITKLQQENRKLKEPK